MDYIGGGIDVVVVVGGGGGGVGSWNGRAERATVVLASAMLWLL